VITSAEAREIVGYDAGKRIKGCKRHLITDTLGLMLRVEVHSASIQDRDGAALALDRITRRFPRAQPMRLDLPIRRYFCGYPPRRHPALRPSQMVTVRR
jgi:hypothetical protein